MFSPGVNLTGAVPPKPLVLVSVYCTKIVAGSPVAETLASNSAKEVSVTACATLITRALILDVAPVNSNPTSEVTWSSVIVLDNLTNSYELSIVGPPGLTAAPSLNTCLPSLASSS